MADIRVLVVVDGIFNLNPVYPVPPQDSYYGSDFWFTVSHFVTTLRKSPSPTFLVDTASRGFTPVPGSTESSLRYSTVTNTLPDPNATLQCFDTNKNPVPFTFDAPNVDLSRYDVLWLFGFEGFDGPGIPVGPNSFISATELAAITKFMDDGGGVFAAGDHDGLGSHMCGAIPRVRYMRKWFTTDDPTPQQPPYAQVNWPGGGPTRADTLVRGATDSTTGTPAFFFDDQSDDIPQVLSPVLPTHPAVQGKSGVLQDFPDHMHEGEVWGPSPLDTNGNPNPVLSATAVSDSTLAFAPAGFVEFPTIGGYQECPFVLATCQVHPHVTNVGETAPGGCENNNFFSDISVCNAKTIGAICAYDGHQVGVGRVVTDSSFHHYLDLNLIGDPCSAPPIKRAGFAGSSKGQAVLAELEAYYVCLATWLSGLPYTRLFVSNAGIAGYDLKSTADRAFAFDYDSSGKLDHLVFYRPGSGALFVIKNREGNAAGNFFAEYFSGNPSTGVYSGVGGFDLKSPVDQAFAFDYDSSGKLDHLVLYRPGSGAIFILKRTGNAFTAVFTSRNPNTGQYEGIGGFDLKSLADRAFAFDYKSSGKLDHLVFYRPGSGALFILEKAADGSFSAVFTSLNPVTNTYQGVGGFDLKSPLDQAIAFDYSGKGLQDHLLLYRPGSGALFILAKAGAGFSDAYVSGIPATGIYHGVAGFDLRSPADRVFAFDHKGSGRLDHLVLYRPGTGALFIAERAGSDFTAVLMTGDPVAGVYNGIGGYDLRSTKDQVMAFDYYATGAQDKLVLYRPGTGTIWMVSGQAEP
jgi:hypothetical protein